MTAKVLGSAFQAYLVGQCCDHPRYFVEAFAVLMAESHSNQVDEPGYLAPIVGFVGVRGIVGSIVLVPRGRGNRLE